MGLNDWGSYEKSAEKGPASLFLKVTALVVGCGLVLAAIGYGLGWFGEAAQVAQEEFGPRAALKKYEWFKEQAAAIKKMDQDVVMYEKRVKDVESRYSSYGENRTKWPLDARIQYGHESQVARDDLVAIASQRNNLVKEYNAASSKFNWSPFQTDPDKPNQFFQEYVVK